MTTAIPPYPCQDSAAPVDWANLPIAPLDQALGEALMARWDQKTKPPGSLGQLERLACQIAQVQGRLAPEDLRPQALIFAGDHGAAAEPGLSAYPQAVTAQMVANFLQGGAAISVLCAERQVPLWVIDAGVAADLPPHPQLIQAKVAWGTQNYRQGPAMTQAQCQAALARGAQVVRQAAQQGANCLVLGEMGIGNSASAALMAHYLTGLPLAALVGPGTGLKGQALADKCRRLEAKAASTGPIDGPLAVLAEVGGFELVMLTGAILAAASARLLVLVDGYMVTAAALAAVKMRSQALGYCVFCHASQEPGHGAVLAHLGVRPLLDLQLRLGEGTGALLALPLAQSALALLSSMASFEHAGVSRAI